MKTRSVVYAPEAQDDLNGLYDWIAEAATSATAIGYIDRIEAFCNGLSAASEPGNVVMISGLVCEPSALSAGSRLPS